MSAALRRRAEGAALAAILALAAAQLLAFTWLDRRPAHDHDTYFSEVVVDALPAYRAASGLDRVALLARFFVAQDTLHPKLPQTWLLFLSGSGGLTRGVLRNSNLPFLLLFVLGVWLLGRELLSPRLALLAAFLALTAPVTVHMSRKFFAHLHAAAFEPWALLLMVRLATGRSHRGRIWLLFGLVQGLRLQCHPIVLPDVLLSTAVAVWGQIRTGPTSPAVLLRSLVLAVLGFLLIAGPYVWSPPGGESGLHKYLRYATRWVAAPDPSIEALGGQLSRLPEIGRALATTLLGPILALWLLLPGALSLIWRALPTRDQAPLRPLILVAGVACAQAPLVLSAHVHSGFLEDWLFLLPGPLVVATAAIGALARRSRTAAGAWAAVLALAGLWTVGAPLLASMSGPDPLQDPEHYRALGMGDLMRSGHGGIYNTHHLAIRAADPGALVAAELVRLAHGPSIDVALIDLAWSPASTNPCGPPGVGLGSWASLGEARDPPWPHAFLAVDLDVRLRPSGPQWREQAALVRLWHADPEASPDPPCPPGRPSARGAIDDAAAWLRAQARLDPEIRVAAIDDPVEWLVGSANPDAPRSGYLRGGLLVTAPSARSAP